MTVVGASTPPSSASSWSRLHGFGSIFAKTVRDSRRAVIVVAGLLALVFIGVSRAIVGEFDTPESRTEIVDLVNAVPPILQGLAGRVVDVGTLGGYLQYKYGVFFPLLVSLWSILALSGTLATEAQRGSLEFVLATGMSRRRVAVEKVGGHILALGIAILVAFFSIALAGRAFAALPGDEISLLSAFAYAVWLGLLALAAGALAFALGSFVGRGAAAGIAGLVAIAGFLLNGYQAAVPELAPFANLTWWGWTADHVALAGRYDWPSVALVAIVTVVLLAIGIEAFARRDLGVTSRIPLPSTPTRLLGLRRPAGRIASLELGPAIAWGAGIGLFGLVFGSAAGGFIDQLGDSPQLMELLSTAFPGTDYASAAGFLQLLFVEIGIVLAGLAGATLVGVWASEETSGRLEMVLATPLTRSRWAISGGVGMLVGVGVFVTLTAIGIAVGVAASGGDAWTPTVGSLSLGLFAAAMVGVGHAVGGLLGSRFAAPVVVVVVLATWFVQLLGTLLGLPDVVRGLALTSHFGQPFVGAWDAVGIAASIVIAVGGIVVGTWAFARRDLLA